MLDRTLLPPHPAITEQDLQNTTPAILNLLGFLLRENMELKRQVEDLTKLVALAEQTDCRTDVEAQPELLQFQPSTILGQPLPEQRNGKREEEVGGEKGPQRTPPDPAYPHGDQNHPAF